MIDRFEKIIGVVASVVLFALMLLTVVDVIGRNIFNHPLIGGSELTELLLVSTAFLLFPQLAFREKHIVADLLDSFDNRVLRATQYVLSGLLGAALFGLIAWRLWILGQRAIGYGDATASLHLPLSPVYFAMSVLSSVTAVAFLLTIHRAFRPFDTVKSESERQASATDLAGLH